jgi:hypothetical protein
MKFLTCIRFPLSFVVLVAKFFDVSIGLYFGVDMDLGELQLLPANG